MDRRSFLRTGVGGVAAATALSGTTWRTALAATVGPGPYGDLRAPDANGISLPSGFTSRVLAVSGSPVAGTGHVWHGAPDGGATIPAGGGGWFYVSNAELSAGAGGASVLAFRSDGSISGARVLLSGTNRNCSGGATPWKTWLSCEETPTGRVWETFPKGGAAVERPAMGRFAHEAAAVDPGRGVVYLTEDVPDGGFYRFRPTAYPDLSAGVLEIATGGTGGPVVWKTVPDPSAATTPTRYQVADARRFDGGEGCVYTDLDDVCYLTTKGDNRVWRYRCDTGGLDVYYAPGSVTNGTAPLTGVDNVTVARNRDVYVAEDGGNLEICLITPGRVVAPFLRVHGHTGSELTGVAFAPNGTRLYFSSQRGTDGRGITYEVRGRFR